MSSDNMGNRTLEFLGCGPKESSKKDYMRNNNGASTGKGHKNGGYSKPTS